MGPVLDVGTQQTVEEFVVMQRRAHVRAGVGAHDRSHLVEIAVGQGTSGAQRVRRGADTRWGEVLLGPGHVEQVRVRLLRFANVIVIVERIDVAQRHA